MGTPRFGRGRRGSDTEARDEKWARSADRKQPPRGRPPMSEEELLAGLRRFARMRKGRAFTTKEFDAWAGRPFCSMTVKKRLGVWREVLERVGVKGAARHEYSGEELLAEFERVWDKLGRRPGDHTLTRHAKLTLDPYRRRWRTIKELGLLVTAMREGKMTREAVLSVDARGEWRQRHLSAAKRYEVLKRDSYKCVVCGRTPATTPGLELEVDHIDPACRGGGRGLENLRTLCRACNLGKGGREEGNAECGTRNAEREDGGRSVRRTL